MEIEDIKQLIKEMELGNLTRLHLRKEGLEIELEKAQIPQASVVHTPMPSPTTISEPVTLPSQDLESSFVTSPMVGIFYSSPSPEDAAFVSPGDQITKEQVVCIIEAMKVMNEVKAQLEGKVVEVLIKNGDPVEFGTKLFRLV